VILKVSLLWFHQKGLVFIDTSQDGRKKRIYCKDAEDPSINLSLMQAVCSLSQLILWNASIWSDLTQLLPPHILLSLWLLHAPTVKLSETNKDYRKIACSSSPQRLHISNFKSLESIQRVRISLLLAWTLRVPAGIICCRNTHEILSSMSLLFILSVSSWCAFHK